MSCSERQQNALRPGQIDEHRHDLRQADGHGQGRHLDDEILAVAIDDQSAQPVAFAEDQIARRRRAES